MGRPPVSLRTPFRAYVTVVCHSSDAEPHRENGILFPLPAVRGEGAKGAATTVSPACACRLYVTKVIALVDWEVRNS